MRSGPGSTPKISVCIVSGRRPEALDDCLASLQQQRGAPPFELLVCADDDPGVELVVRRRFPHADVILVEKTNPSAGRNHLIARARGELLLWLDDDITFGPDLLRWLGVLADEHPDVSVFGGPNETPANSNRFQWVQGAVLASMIASGPVRRRYGSHPAGRADERWFILCNLAVRRSVMRRFDDALVCAEENALLGELHDAGEQMLYEPSLRVFHERRADLNGFIRQMHKYGRGRGQLARRAPSSIRLAFLVPSVLVLYLAATPVLAWISAWALAPAVAYLLAVVAGGAKVSRSLHRPWVWLLATTLIVTLHLSYGAGCLRGMLNRGPTPRRDTEDAGAMQCTP